MSASTRIAARWLAKQAGSYRILPTKWAWEDGTPLLSTPLRRAGTERYATPDGVWSVAKGPRFWYWEKTDSPEINSDEAFPSKRAAVDSLARHLQ
jgi:hypothetical protein